MRKNTLAFDIALAQARRDPKRPQPACIDHSDEFCDFEVPPDEESAALLCERCPLLALCYESATKSKPAWGVQGGVTWLDGRQIRWLEKFGYLDADSFLNPS